MSGPLPTSAAAIEPAQVEAVKKKRCCPVVKAMQWLASKSTEIKKQVDGMGAEVNQRQDKMKFIDALVSDINSLTDEKNTLDITNCPEILEKLRIAREELKVNLPETKLKFNQLERDRLIENLHLASEGWNKENRTQTQKIDIHAKLLDQVMTIVKSMEKNDNQTKHSLARAVKGG